MTNLNYMNSAGSSIMSDQTVDVIMDYLRLEQSIGGYEAMGAKQAEFEQFYQRVAKMINAKSIDEIAFTDGGSRGWNALINGIDLDRFDSFITLSSEYLTNITTLQICAEQNGKNIHVIDCALDGGFDLDSLQSIATNERACIVISQATAQGSITNPVKEIGIIAQETESIYILDATQSIGQIPIDVQEIGCDAMTATGRKWLRGPRGTGFIYVKAGAPFTTASVDGSSSKAYYREDKIKVEIVSTARQFEMWERNYGLMLGLSNAIQEYMVLGMTDVHQKIYKNANILRTAIANNSSLQLVGKVDSPSGIIGIIAQTEAVHTEIIDRFSSNKITVNLVYDWACPLFFESEAKVIRLGAHHDVDPKHIDLVAEVISTIGQ